MLCQNIHLAASPRKVEPCPPLFSEFKVLGLEMDKSPYLYLPRRPYFIQTVLGIHWGRHKPFPLVSADLMLWFELARGRTVVE